MKSPDFHYECPATLGDALAKLASETEECRPLAGGQSLLPMMNLRLAAPEILLDLNMIEELAFIRQEESHVCIGAMVRYSELLGSSIISQHIPLFSKALPHVAHQAIRNRGTIGGSVALADPAAEMPALLRALNASIVVVSSSGRREILADDFFLGVYETALEHSELVHSIQVPMVGTEYRFGFYELARRHGDYAMAGVAISAASTDPYADLRIVFFSLGDHALRATDAEAILQGEHFSESIVDKAKQALTSLEINEDINASQATKVHLAGVVLRRALADMENRQS